MSRVGRPCRRRQQRRVGRSNQALAPLNHQKPMLLVDREPASIRRPKRHAGSGRNATHDVRGEVKRANRGSLASNLGAKGDRTNVGRPRRIAGAPATGRQAPHPPTGGGDDRKPTSGDDGETSPVRRPAEPPARPEVLVRRNARRYAPQSSTARPHDEDGQPFLLDAEECDAPSRRRQKVVFSGSARPRTIRRNRPPGREM